MTAKNTPEILVLTAPDEGALPGLEVLEGEATVSYARDEESLEAGLKRADVLVVTDFRTELLRKVWPQQHRIKWLHATSAGVDALMFPELLASDIRVTNARAAPRDSAVASGVAAIVARTRTVTVRDISDPLGQNLLIDSTLLPSMQRPDYRRHLTRFCPQDQLLPDH